jgi:aspartate aminotransferase-like enzyme
MNKTSKLPKFYFNWAKELANLQKNQTNYTPAISLIVGLRESLRMMKADGLETIYRRAEILAKATREGAIALGLKVFAKNPSPAVTAICAPEGIDGQAIYNLLWKKYGVTGAGGQDQLKGKIFRLATLGYADKYDVVTAVAALEFAMKELGHKFTMGAGVGKAMEVLEEL